MDFLTIETDRLERAGRPNHSDRPDRPDSSIRLEAAWHGPPPERAPTLVFLHEGLGSVSLWRDFPARLAARTGLGALVYSRRGYGRSDSIQLPRSVRFMYDEAEVLERVLDAAGIREAVPVGHSDGASIALIHAATHPGERVRALALEAPHVFVENVTVASIAAIGEVYRTTDLRRRLEKHHGDNTDAAFRGWNEVWLDPAFRDWNIEALLPRVRVPVLVVQGTDDEYGSARQIEALERGVGGSVETLLLDGCGHSPHRDRPDAVLDAMAGFVSGVI